MIERIAVVQPPACQSKALPSASGHVSRLSDLGYRACNHYRRYGLRETVQKLGAYLRGLVQKRQSEPVRKADRSRRPAETCSLCNPVRLSK